MTKLFCSSSFMLGWLFLTLFSSDLPPVFALYKIPKPPGIEILVPAPVPYLRVTAPTPPLKKNQKNAWAIYDVQSGMNIVAHADTVAKPIASLTKLMTAHIILRDHALDEIVQVPLESIQTEGVKSGLYAYEKVTIQTLLEAILIGSANDAARTLAIYNADSEKEFVIKMNREARYLGLPSALFYNASGLDIYPSKSSDGKIQGNQMSVRDLSILSRLLLQNDFFRTTIAKDVWIGSSVDGKFEHQMKTTNELLYQDNIKGLKTGYTLLAKQCFIALVEQNGKEYLTIILGSEDRFGQTQKFINWGTENMRW